MVCKCYKVRYYSIIMTNVFGKLIDLIAKSTLHFFPIRTLFYTKFIYTLRNQNVARTLCRSASRLSSNKVPCIKSYVVKLLLFRNTKLMQFMQSFNGHLNRKIPKIIKVLVSQKKNILFVS